MASFCLLAMVSDHFVNDHFVQHRWEDTWEVSISAVLLVNRSFATVWVPHTGPSKLSDHLQKVHTLCAQNDCQKERD
uniref:Secreted protein n=1 Tax=Steinernema glaseri TaxID=37863 RepID=A0A1I7XYN6_9BILA